VLGLCVGAASPDIVDGTIGPIIKGGLGQWYGHTLVGMVFLCVPAGMLVTWLMAKSGTWLVHWKKRPWSAWYAENVAIWNRTPERVTHPLFFMAFSVLLGAFSHLLIDFISHGQFLWLYPWYENKHFFPEWWYIAWFRIPLPGYQESYPVGPHLMIWLFLGVLGAIMLFWPLLRKKPGRGPLI